VKAQVTKTHDQVEISTLILPSHSEHCITVQASKNQEMTQTLRQAAADRNATILSQFIFAGTRHYEDFREGIEKTEWPVVWLQGDACQDGNILSAQAVAISGVNTEAVKIHGRKVGFVYETDDARFCRLGDLLPADLSASREEQTRSAFETMKEALEQHGFAVTDTVRTWIYLDKLLDWYDSFNVVRTAFFKENDIFNHLVPASTGIGAFNPYGSAIMLDALAVQPKTDAFTIQEVISPLQNPALDYRSSFSRAVELASPLHKTVMISGTASIDPDGATVHLDDPEKQIRLTMEVVHAMLVSRGMDWTDLSRGIAYFKNMDYQPIYEKVAAEFGIPAFPLAVSHADVCRHDLLFEIEVDATQAIG
jgi:enamine deaminase RidA (YjgF/YER057c/UK114 family)